MNWLSSYIFQYQLLAPDISDISPFNIITVSCSTFTQITTQLSASPTISSEFCGSIVVSQWLPKDDKQCVLICVSDSFQLVVMSSFYSLSFQFPLGLFAPFPTLQPVFHLSISSCSYSQSTVNTITQFWHCVKDCSCVMISL
jgi:hypothetical protein